jgi:hypothetical protein
MKIIGQSRDGYLIDATEQELALCAGYLGHADADWKKVRPSLGGSWDSQPLSIGAQILPVVTPYMNRLRENEAKAKASAEMLRTLADMITSHLPTTIIPVSEDTADQEKQSHVA